MPDITALYIRISLEDMDLDELKQESNSIQNQRLHLRNYLVSNPDAKIGQVREFADDGYSGTNFERPAFQEMLELAHAGQVKCIIIKDFSRLGRNYLGVGNFLEQVFPSLNIRVISVDDLYDSYENQGDVPGVGVVFKNIIHDYYSKELSVKVIQARRGLAKKGLFMAGIPPYGYLKDPNDKYHLVVDPDSAKVVRLIFSFVLEGKRTSEIARILNERKIESPARRLWRLGIRGRNKSKEEIETFIWRSDVVGKILRNEVVLGHVVNHKVERKQIGRAGLKHVDVRDHIVIPDMHEAIIDQQTFDKVQCLIQQNKTGRINRNLVLGKYPLSGIVRCGHCGRSMVIEGKKYKTYICTRSRVSGEAGHRKVKVQEQELLDTVANIIYFAVKLQSEEVGVGIEERRREKVLSCEKNDNSVEGRRKFLELYEQYAGGRISKEEFMVKKELISRQSSEVNSSPEESNLFGESTMKRELEEIVRLDDSSWLCRELLHSIISEIRVFPGQRVEIVWKCKDWFERCG